MNHILQLIQEYHEWFYLLTFVWTALEGETFVIFAGLAAQKDLLDIRILFVAAALGSMLGDQVMFVLGRFYGRRIVARFPKIKPKLDKVFVTLEKYSTSFILSYRFMYGLRNVSALAIGMSNLSWRRFTVLNTIASFLWSLVFCGSGYLFGDIMAHLGYGSEEETVNFEVRGFMLSALAIFLIIISIRLWIARRREIKEAESLARKEPS